MKRIIAPIVFLLLSGGSVLFGQEFTIPEDLKFETPADYAKYEPEILQCIHFLETDPLGETEERKEASGFFIAWMSGCPNVSAEVYPYVMELSRVNREFFVIFLGGWTKYALNHPMEKVKINGHLAGLRAIIRVYTINAGAKRDPAVDEIIQAEKNGTLDVWLNEKL